MRSFIYPMTSNSQVEILGDGYAANIICNDKPFMHITREEIYELQES
jgi:hypothetical protein